MKITIPLFMWPGRPRNQMSPGAETTKKRSSVSRRPSVQELPGGIWLDIRNSAGNRINIKSKKDVALFVFQDYRWNIYISGCKNARTTDCLSQFWCNKAKRLST